MTAEGVGRLVNSTLAGWLDDPAWAAEVDKLKLIHEQALRDIYEKLARENASGLREASALSRDRLRGTPMVDDVGRPVMIVSADDKAKKVQARKPCDGHEASSIGKTLVAVSREADRFLGVRVGRPTEVLDVRPNHVEALRERLRQLILEHPWLKPELAAAETAQIGD